MSEIRSNWSNYGARCVLVSRHAHACKEACSWAGTYHSDSRPRMWRAAVHKDPRSSVWGKPGRPSPARRLIEVSSSHGVKVMPITTAQEPERIMR